MDVCLSKFYCNKRAIYFLAALTCVDLSSGTTALPRYNSGGGGGRRDVLPPLVPPKLVDDDDDFEERDVAADDAADAAGHSGRRPPGHRLHLASSHWAPTLDNLSPGEAEFYRRGALANAITGRSARLMGRSADGLRRRRRSKTTLRMGRAASKSFDREALNILRMGKRELGENHFIADV